MPHVFCDSSKRPIYASSHPFEGSRLKAPLSESRKPPCKEARVAPISDLPAFRGGPRSARTSAQRPCSGASSPARAAMAA
eukprot:8409873-Pyramimonas_sp.AAC.1